MFHKLDQVVLRYQEITDRLSSPGLDPRDIQKLGREQANLRQIVDTYQELKSAQQSFADNKLLLETESDEEMRQLVKNDILELEQKIDTLEQALKILLLPKDPMDDKNIILEIRAGTGGEEAALFCANLFRMYSRFAEINGWKTEILSTNETGKGGFKEVILLISGDRVYSKLKFEGGTHRVQRVPETEASGRIHTSACTVAVLPEVEDVDVEVNESDLRIDVYRASGAGGQHVNKTESAVRLTHIPTGIVVACQDERSQHKNKARAMKVLKAKIYDQTVQQQMATQSSARKLMVGSGDRSEKIRTYNFPQSRVTDHRVGLTLHDLDAVMDGKLVPVIDALIANHQAELLKSSTEETTS